MKKLLIIISLFVSTLAVAQGINAKDVEKMKQRLNETNQQLDAGKAKMEAMLDTQRKLAMQQQMERNNQTLVNIAQENEKKKKRNAIRNIAIGGSMSMFFFIVLYVRRKKSK